MTPETLRNLPHIASLAFNEPLLLEPAYAQVFFCALAGQMGITRLTDAVAGVTLSQAEIANPRMLFGEEDDDMPQRIVRSYQVQDGIAILPVAGTLVGKTRSLQPYSGMTGYNGIVTRLQQAMDDPSVDGVLLDMDTPGGMVSGAFDCADMIARLREIKPVWALANDMNCSAGQLIASAATRRLVTQTAKTGSIGVMMAHSNYSGALKTQGVEVTLVYSGAHKVDGNPYAKLPADVRASLQQRIDATRQMFAEKVSAYTGMSVDAVLDTEAEVYTGQDSIDIGIADELVNNTDALSVMREALDNRKKTISGGFMPGHAASAETTTTAATTVAATPAVPATPAAPAATAAQPAAAATVTDISTQVAEAVNGENARIMGILNCEEANGRDSQARVLAETPGMSVETARRILGAAPKNAQIRTETALDHLMANAPAAVSAAAQQSDGTLNDLMNTPV